MSENNNNIYFNPGITRNYNLNSLLNESMSSKFLKQFASFDLFGVAPVLSF